MYVCLSVPSGPEELVIFVKKKIMGKDSPFQGQRHHVAEIFFFCKKKIIFFEHKKFSLQKKNFFC